MSKDNSHMNSVLQKCELIYLRMLNFLVMMEPNQWDLNSDLKNVANAEDTQVFSTQLPS